MSNKTQNSQNQSEAKPTEYTLDPEDWPAMEQLAVQMAGDMMAYLQGLENQPSWKPIPLEVKKYLEQKIPITPQSPEEVYQEFKDNILPYNKGNIHPRFFAWVQGTGTPLGALADLLASTMNPNVTIGEHTPMYVDKQVVEWCKQLLNFPSDSSGILVSGGSMANITALTVARNSFLGPTLRQEGLVKVNKQLVIYCSTETHSCILKAAEILGVGTNHVRKIGVNDSFEMKIDELKTTIQKDKANGLTPFAIVATTGTVNTGAIDPLEAIHHICQQFGLWMHIDGAYGALAKLDTHYADALKYIEKADSVAFDLHKWLFIPYEVGCTLIKDAAAHRASFAITPNYLLQTERGLAGGLDSINNYGFELSRGFKALKVWMSLKEHGRDKYAQLIAQNNRQAEYLGKKVEQTPSLELVAPVSMSIVCFRFVDKRLTEEQLNDLNEEILLQLQENGIASPSSTILNGKYCIRVCIVNHRTKNADLDLLLEKALEIGQVVFLKKIQ